MKQGFISNLFPSISGHVITKISLDILIKTFTSLVAVKKYQYNILKLKEEFV